MVFYIFLISLFLNFVTPKFIQNGEQFYAPIIMLITFVFSAVISATMILGRAGMLFWEKKYIKSFTLLGWTTGWGLFYLVLFLGILLKK